MKAGLRRDAADRAARAEAEAQGIKVKLNDEGYHDWPSP
jgi:hypothetical protein